MSVKQITGDFRELNDTKKRLKEAEARYDELHVDCSAMVTVIKRLLKNESRDSNKRISLALETFCAKHLNRSIEIDHDYITSTPGAGIVVYRESAKVINKLISRFIEMKAF